MSYPLFVVWLFKTIVVVDGKWVWDSWILKNRHRVNGVKNMLCCWRLSEQSFLTEMEAETHRGRTFASWKAKVKLSHLWLQPKLNVKSQALNRNACVTPNYHKTAYATKKMIKTMKVSQNTSNDFSWRCRKLIGCVFWERVQLLVFIWYIWNSNPRPNPTCVCMCVCVQLANGSIIFLRLGAILLASP